MVHSCTRALNSKVPEEPSETTEKVKEGDGCQKQFQNTSKSLYSFNINGFRGIIEASKERKNKDASTESEPDEFLQYPV